MKKILFVVLLTVLTITTNSYGQNKMSIVKTNKKSTVQDKLVGTWKLVEFADIDSLTGNWKYRYGKNPKGYFTYTKNGIVNLNISSTIP